MKQRSAWVVGASGQLGRECVNLLCADARYERVLGVVRRATGLTHGKYRERVVDFDDPSSFAEMGHCDDLYFALGQSSRDRALFHKVDCAYALAWARHARMLGARHMGYVSSLGARLDSPSHYLQIKAQAESGLAALGFDSLFCIRPSMMHGRKDAVRPLQRLARHVTRYLGWAFFGPLRRYRAVGAMAVAATLIEAINGPLRGNRIIESEEIPQETQQAFPSINPRDGTSSS